MKYKLTRKAGFLLAIFGAAVVGGASTALVNAAIPSTSDGQIHACYRNSASLTDQKGALRVIDSQATPTQSCSAQETSLNFGQKTNSLVLKDSNGQVLGDLVNYRATHSINDGGLDGVQVYNNDLKRIIAVAYDQAENNIAFGFEIPAYFQSSDCSGQAYAASDVTYLSKTTLYRWNIFNVRNHAIVTDAATATSLQIHSIATRQTASDLNGVCVPYDDSVSVFPLTSVSLPFTEPVASPLKF